MRIKGTPSKILKTEGEVEMHEFETEGEDDALRVPIREYMLEFNFRDPGPNNLGPIYLVMNRKGPGEPFVRRASDAHLGAVE